MLATATVRLALDAAGSRSQVRRRCTVKCAANLRHDCVTGDKRCGCGLGRCVVTRDGRGLLVVTSRWSLVSSCDVWFQVGVPIRGRLNLVVDASTPRYFDDVNNERSKIPVMSEPRWLNDEEARMWRGYRVMSSRITQAIEQQLVADWECQALTTGFCDALGATDHRLRTRDLAGAQLGAGGCRISSVVWNSAASSPSIMSSDARDDLRSHRGGFDLIRQAAHSLWNGSKGLHRHS